MLISENIRGFKAIFSGDLDNVPEAAFFNVDKTGARLLCDYAVSPENIDEESERLEIEEATLALREKQSHVDYITSQLTLAKALNNLKIKRSHSGDETRT